MSGIYTEILSLGERASVAAARLEADRDDDAAHHRPFHPDAVEHLRSSAVKLIEAGTKILRSLEDEPQV